LSRAFGLLENSRVLAGEKDVQANEEEGADDDEKGFAHEEDLVAFRSRHKS